MKKFLSLFVLLVLVLNVGARQKPGRELSGLLLSYMQLEDVHPDSLERNIADLKLRRMQSQDAAERAVYAAAIGRLYGARMYWRSVGTDLRDSMLVWYGKALADKQVLARTKAKKWKPFVVVGKDEDYFRGDMLNVVWRSMTEQVGRTVRDTCSVLPGYEDMIGFYRSQGLREAALLLAIDSLYGTGREVTQADLLRLRDDYADVPLCAELYLRLATEGDQTVFQRREWLQQGLAKYPKYRRRTALQNELTRLSNPTFQWKGPRRVYPGKAYQWVFTARNVQSVLINGEEHRFPQHDSIETFTDTLQWTAPQSGTYPLTFVPRTSAKVIEKVKPLTQEIYSTALQAVYQALPDGRVQMLVVDSETGRPQPGVTVTAYKPTRLEKDTVPYFQGHTGENGKIQLPFYKDDKQPRYNYTPQLRYRLSRADEPALPVVAESVYETNQKWTGAATDSTQYVRLFADRAIYRPGQTVHVSGLAYSQLEWNAHVQAGREMLLTLYDANGRKVEEKACSTDAFGVFACDFELPAGGRNGTFRVSSSSPSQSLYFRVEEYKRPTFEVVLGDSLRLRADSVEVRGVARNYDGSPLRNARVTGTYRWQTPWIYYGKRWPAEETFPLDTLLTDDEGRIRYRLPLSADEGQRRSLFVTLDVLSQQGETHNAQRWYWRELQLSPQRPPVMPDSTFIVRCEVDSFAIDRPGRITVTTKLHDVYLHYTLAAAGKVWRDDMVRLDSETFTLDVPYREEYDQSLTASFCFVKEGHVYTQDATLWLVRPDNQLRLHWDTFRDLVQPGQQEEWRLTLRRPDGTPADANLMLTLYDASLDYFAENRWDFSVWRNHRTYRVYYQEPMSARERSIWSLDGYYSQKTKKERAIDLTRIDPELFQVGAYTRSFGRGPIMYKATNTVMLTAAAPMAMREESAEVVEDRAVLREVAVDSDNDAAAEVAEEEETLCVPMRENFDETAFFMPQLRTDKDGQVSIAFTLPESLTRWNLLGVAHTGDMLYANLREQIEARKDLMAQLYLPRFLRPGDEAVLTASIRNVSDQPQQGRGVMQILDAKTEKVLKTWKTTFDLSAQRDTVLHYPYALSPKGESEGAFIVRWAVEGTTCSDGEQRLLPVLPATMHVTNTIAITAYDPSVQNIDLSKIFPGDVTDRRLTIEYTTHPEQYALQALPPLARAKRADVLSLAAAYYAGVLGKALGVAMPDSTAVYLQKIKDLQNADGAFSWYPQMPASPYLTREVSYLFTRLRMLTGDAPCPEVHEKAVHYLLAQRIDSTYLSVADLRTLYIVQYSGVQLSRDEQRKVNFLLKLAKREDVEEDGYERQALLAVVLKQAGADRKARKCAAAFRRYIVGSPDRGSYIEFPKGSFTSIDRKLHIHVQLMEALQRMNPRDTLLPAMRRHLLQQKRTQEWSTPVNTANAVFALLNNGEPRPGSESPAKDVLTLYRRGSKQANFVALDDTLGYVRDSLIIAEGHLPTKLRLQKASKGESWGGVYADFEQRFDQVEAQTTGLAVRQEYPPTARTGSRYTVRYRIVADRDYEYVTLVCPRPAFTEPVDQRSGYRWGGGLGYYRQVHDATTEFSICQLPRGEYLIEETLYVERGGAYHAGVSVIRCEYAEEFQGHSSDCVVKVEN